MMTNDEELSVQEEGQLIELMKELTKREDEAIRKGLN